MLFGLCLNKRHEIINRHHSITLSAIWIKLTMLLKKTDLSKADVMCLVIAH